MTKKICPICEEYREVEDIKGKQTVKVRGEQFSVNVHYHRCSSCSEEFESSKSDVDTVAEAFSKYRKKHCLLTPSQIKEFRQKFDLTQKELTLLLGWGAVTLSRYENGALQNLSHDRELQEANTAEGFLKLIELTPNALSDKKRERLISILLKKRGKRINFLTSLDASLSSIQPDITNGYQRFNIEKFFAVVEFFCSRTGVLKTKLNKLLFYADFVYFKKNQISITGARYAALPYGPCPNDYRKIYALMEEDLSLIKTEEIFYPNTDIVGEKLVTISNNHISTLSETELGFLKDIKISFEKLTASEITAISHKEIGWKKTKLAKLISYTHAKSISL